MAQSGEPPQLRLILAAASVSAVLSVLTTILAIGYVRQKNLRDLAQVETARANAAVEQVRESANRRMRTRDQAEELAGYILDELRDELFQLGRSDLLASACEKAVAYFDSLPPDLATPESRSKHASVLLTLSDARYQQGDHAGAIAAARRAIDLWNRLAEAGDPTGDFFIRAGRAMGELGLYQNQSGDYYAARETFLQMLRYYEDPSKPFGRDGWREHGQAKARLGLGENERLRKNYPEARQEYLQSISLIEKALARNPEEISWLQMLMNAHNDLGVVFMHEKDYARAEQSLQSALVPVRHLIQLEPKNRRWEKELASALLNLGSLLHLRKESARAEPFLREAVVLRQGLADWDPKSTRAALKVAHAWHRLAQFQFDTADPTNALTSARNALLAYRRLLTIDPGDESTIAEMRDQASKYGTQLVNAGLRDSARSLIQETTTFARANRAGRPGADAWEELLSSLNETAARLDARPAPGAAAPTIQ